MYLSLIFLVKTEYSILYKKLSNLKTISDIYQLMT